MARVNHKSIKRLIHTENRTYTDKEFFLSREFAAYLQDILDMISCSYNTKKIARINIIWDESENATVACTDSDSLIINASNVLIKNLERVEKYESILGLLMHETGHILYTNFPQNIKIKKELLKGNLINVPDMMYEDAYKAYEKVRDYISTIKNQQIIKVIIDIWSTLSNSLEDGHVDVRIGQRYPGYKPHLDYINDLCYDYQPTVAEIKKRRNQMQVDNPDEPVVMIYDFLQYLLSYSKYGFLKGEDWEIKQDKAAMKIYELIEWIDLSKETNNSIDRMLYQSIVFYKAFPFDYIDALLSKYGNEENSRISEESKKVLNDVLNAHNPIAQNSTSVTGENLLSKGNGNAPIGDEPRGTASKEQGNILIGNSSKEAQDSSEEKISSENKNKTEENAKHNSEQDTEQSPESSLCSSSLNEKNKDEGLEEAEKAMNSIMNKIKKNENMKQREQHLEQELNTFAATIKHNDIHKGIASEINRIDVPDDATIRSYDNVWPDLAPISKKLVGKLSKELEKKRKGYKQKNLYFGRKLEVSTVIRGDGKYFSKKQLPSEKKRLSVGLLVDESGSMRSMERIHYARMASLILYDFCNRLDIPIAVYGHSTSGNEVVLNAYAEYDSIDKYDKYRIMKMSAHGSNRDGYALRYMAERLEMQNTEIKLLFIISDGCPNHTGYNYESAYEDLASIKKEYYRKNIITIAAAIGDDKETIEHIYGKEAFLNITNLQELPVNLISIIKQYL